MQASHHEKRSKHSYHNGQEVLSADIASQALSPELPPLSLMCFGTYARVGDRGEEGKGYWVGYAGVGLE